LGSGIGLTTYRRLAHASGVSLPRNELIWFAGAVLAGGVIAPVLLMLGLTHMPASSASLLLNAEAVFTALLAWLVFKENFDQRIAFGMLSIVAGAVVLSWNGESRIVGMWPAFAILGACLAWGIDNNLTRKVSLSDATWIASIKGLVAGMVNLTIATLMGVAWPPVPNVLAAMLVGLLAYGVSLSLFVLALRHLGTARTGAYFSVAPFFGALLAILMGESVTIPILAAGVLMAIGTWLHLTERHKHKHTHEEMMHDHEHVHDAHHQHPHDSPVAPGIKHRHLHRHVPLTHVHLHFPDIHHRHHH
jgi:drug/metabolite transporter (DMT)-like permease